MGAIEHQLAVFGQLHNVNIVLVFHYNPTEMLQMHKLAPPAPAGIAAGLRSCEPRPAVFSSAKAVFRCDMYVRLTAPLYTSNCRHHLLATSRPSARHAIYTHRAVHCRQTYQLAFVRQHVVSCPSHSMSTLIAASW